MGLYRKIQSIVLPQSGESLCSAGFANQLLCCSKTALGADQLKEAGGIVAAFFFATVYKGNIIKNLIMDCQSYTKYRPNETTGGIFVSWRRKEELPTGA